MVMSSRPSDTAQMTARHLILLSVVPPGKSISHTTSWDRI